MINYIYIYIYSVIWPAIHPQPSRPHTAPPRGIWMTSQQIDHAKKKEQIHLLKFLNNFGGHNEAISGL